MKANGFLELPSSRLPSRPRDLATSRPRDLATSRLRGLLRSVCDSHATSSLVRLDVEAEVEARRWRVVAAYLASEVVVDFVERNAALPREAALVQAEPEV